MSSYDTGNKPFKHDVSRGKWISSKHFYTACIAHAFCAQYFTSLPLYIVLFGGIIFGIQFVFGMMVFGAPVIFMESFLGQFSQSGYISVFRIAPLFKGMGYTILLLNILSASYYAVYAAIPLIYIFGSMNPTLPWMTCHNSWNTLNCTTETLEISNTTSLLDISWAVEEYLQHAVMAHSPNESEGFMISWRILICLIFVWLIITMILFKGIEFIGLLLYRLTLVILSMMAILFIRNLFVPSAHLYLFDFFKPHHYTFTDLDNWILAPYITSLVLGSGWGSVLTMASYNSFKEDIGKLTWLISFGHFGIFCVCGLWSRMIEEYLETNHNFRSVFYHENRINLGYTAYPFFFGQIEFPQLWSAIFFSMIFLGELAGCVIQIFSILTAIFDEFEMLRIYKKGITIILILFLFLQSLLYASNKGMRYIFHLYSILDAVTLFILFIEILTIVWIYGRERYQRDIHFMLKTTYSKWKFFIMKYITPFMTLFLVYINIIHMISNWFLHRDITYVINGLILKGVPFLLFPSYIIWKLRSTTGSFKERFIRLCRPTDWYPADPVDRRNYEELLGAGSDTFKQIIDLEDIEYEEE